MPSEARSIGASTPTDDPALWARLRTRDHEAVGLLFDRHGHAVYNFAFRRTASWSVAEDLVQATFTTVWRKAADGSLPALDGTSALPWLLGVASNESLNSARRQRRVDRRQGRLGPPVSVADHADEVAGRIDDERRMVEVRRALEQLPAHERVTIELVAWSGVSTAEAAAVLGVAEGTVKSRLARGRSRLIALLGPSSSGEDS